MPQQFACELLWGLLGDIGQREYADYVVLFINYGKATHFFLSECLAASSDVGVGGDCEYG